ncbi:MAG: hypothetical protein ABEI53_02415, partial [Candidatus Magasanikbacteria bacterium]
MNNLRNKYTYFLFFLVIIIGFSFFSFAKADSFQEPTQPFPGGNPSAPIDTSDNTQTKEGSLNIGVSGNDSFLNIKSFNSGSLKFGSNGICLNESAGGSVVCKGFWNQIDRIHFGGSEDGATLFWNGDLSSWATSTTLYNDGDQVGVSTTDPQSEFHVRGTSTFEGEAGNKLITLKLPGSGGATSTIKMNSQGQMVFATSSGAGPFYLSDLAGLVNGPLIPRGSAGSTLYWNNNTSRWATTTELYSNGAQVGVSTTDPQSEFHVRGTS